MWTTSRSSSSLIVSHQLKSLNSLTISHKHKSNKLHYFIQVIKLTDHKSSTQIIKFNTLTISHQLKSSNSFTVSHQLNFIKTWTLFKSSTQVIKLIDCKTIELKNYKHLLKSLNSLFVSNQTQFIKLTESSTLTQVIKRLILSHQLNHKS